MMIQPAIILRCSACLGFLYMITKSSGWIWPAAFWTDGKVSVWKHDGDPKLLVCPHCKALHWTEELEHHGEIHVAQQIFEETRNVKFCRVPSVNDYFCVLERPGARTRERYGRLGLMWKYNDQRRNESSNAPGPLFRESENLKALARLLEESVTSDLVLKAEIMRELGCFAEARALVKRLTGNGDSKIAEAIDRLSLMCDSKVRKVPRDLP